MIAILIARIISTLISLYIGVLFVRMILDWVRFFARDFRPRGVVLVLANVVYALTDPPLRFLARYIPVARIGNVGLDIGFLVLLFALWLARRLMWMLVFWVFL